MPMRPNLNVDRYKSVDWQGVTDQATRGAVRDVAQKLERLAMDISVGLVNVGGIIMTTEDECPPGWELVAEFVDRVPLGTDDVTVVGTTGGSMTHAHDIPEQASPTTSSNGAHTHAIELDGTHNHAIDSDASHTHPTTATSTSKKMENAADGDVTYINSIGVNTGAGSSHNHGGVTSTDPDHSHGGATGSNGAHTHTVPAHDHGGETDDTDATPAHVRVLFCRRIR